MKIFSRKSDGSAGSSGRYITSPRSSSARPLRSSRSKMPCLAVNSCLYSGPKSTPRRLLGMPLAKVMNSSSQFEVASASSACNFSSSIGGSTCPSATLAVTVIRTSEDSPIMVVESTSTAPVRLATIPSTTPTVLASKRSAGTKTRRWKKRPHGPRRTRARKRCFSRRSTMAIISGTSSSADASKKSSRGNSAIVRTTAFPL